MANLTVTAGAVVPDTGYGIATGTSSANISAGNLVYLDATDSYTVKLSEATNSTKASVVGVALNGASVGQPVTYMTSGTFAFTTTAANTVAVGTVLAVSATAGAIAPVSDHTTGSGKYISVVGVATVTNKITIGIVKSGVAI